MRGLLAASCDPAPEPDPFLFKPNQEVAVPLGIELAHGPSRVAEHKIKRIDESLR